jgi:hypothetical protein
MRRRIEEQYNDYARRVIPADASGTQRTEMRQAFFAGALSVLVMIETLSMGDNGLVEFGELRAEMEAFAESAARRAGRRHAH